MSEIVPFGAGSDITPQGGTGAGVGFLALAGRVTAMATSAWRLKEGMHLLKRRMEKNAQTARRLSEMCGQAEVEPRYTAQILEVSTALLKVAQGAGDLADTADRMAAGAEAVKDTHQQDYRGIYEAVQASSVQQAKPGFYQTK